MKFKVFKLSIVLKVILLIFCFTSANCQGSGNLDEQLCDNLEKQKCKYNVPSNDNCKKQYNQQSNQCENDDFHKGTKCFQCRESSTGGLTIFKGIQCSKSQCINDCFLKNQMKTSSRRILHRKRRRLLKRELQDKISYAEYSLNDGTTTTTTSANSLAYDITTLPNEQTLDFTTASSCGQTRGTCNQGVPKLCVYQTAGSELDITETSTGQTIKFNTNVATNFDLQFSCQLTTLNTNCNDSNVVLDTSSQYRYVICGSQVTIKTGQFQINPSIFQLIASTKHIILDSQKMQIPEFTTFDNRIYDDMNNHCPLESIKLDNPDLIVENNYVWPYKTDANKLIVPPAIEKLYSFNLTLHFKGGHSEVFVGGPYVYRVYCSGIGVSGSIGDSTSYFGLPYYLQDRNTNSYSFYFQAQPNLASSNTFTFPDVLISDVDTCPIIDYRVSNYSQDVKQICSPLGDYSCKEIQFSAGKVATHTATYDITTAGGRTTQYSIALVIKCGISIVTQVS